MKVIIKRYPFIAFATFGELELEGSPFKCHTIELPWRDNKTNISCIPAGTYRAVRKFSNRFNRVLWFLEVPSRTGIMIHPANVASELRGCIALGKEYACVKGEWGVARSIQAIKEFHEATQDFEELEVTIFHAYSPIPFLPRDGSGKFPI